MDAEYRRQNYLREKRGYDVAAAAAAKGGQYADSDAAIARVKHEKLAGLRAAAIAAGDPDPHPDFDTYFAPAIAQVAASTDPAFDAIVMRSIARALAGQVVAVASDAPPKEDPAIAAARAAEAERLAFDTRVANIGGVPVAQITADRHAHEAEEREVNAHAAAQAADEAEIDAIVARIAAA